MNYKLTYRISRKSQDASCPTFTVGAWTEQVEESLILHRMKEIQEEHNENVKGLIGVPQFALFFPIEKVE